MEAARRSPGFQSTVSVKPCCAISSRCSRDRPITTRSEKAAAFLDAYHAAVTLAAIAAGKHVLVEKPMCMTLREADEIGAAQAQAEELPPARW